MVMNKLLRVWKRVRWQIKLALIIILLVGINILLAKRDERLPKYTQEECAQHYDAWINNYQP